STRPSKACAAHLTSSAGRGATGSRFRFQPTSGLPSASSSTAGAFASSTTAHHFLRSGTLLLLIREKSDFLPKPTPRPPSTKSSTEQRNRFGASGSGVSV